MSFSQGLSKCCISGTLHEGTPTGTVETINGLETYVARPEGGSTAKSIIFLTDIFGWAFPNVRLLADAYARAGFTAYVPDLLHGDALPISFLQAVEPPLKVRLELSPEEVARNNAELGATFMPWLGRHPEAVVRAEIDGFVTAIRAVEGTRRVGAVGFCWGGRYAIFLAAGGVDAAFACHPSLTGIPDYEAVNKPLALAVGEKDSMLDMEMVGRIREALEKRDVPTEVRVYEDQVHGFTIRGDWSSKKDQKAMDDSLRQGIEWFDKYLV